VRGGESVRLDKKGREDVVEISCKTQVSCSKIRPEQEGKRLDRFRSVSSLSNKDSGTNKPGKEGGA